MKEVISIANAITPNEGVVLLSPAAPSYGMYKDFSERGKDFAFQAGFSERIPEES